MCCCDSHTSRGSACAACSKVTRHPLNEGGIRRACHIFTLNTCSFPSHTPTMLIGAFSCLQSHLHAENSKNIPGVYTPTVNIYSVQKSFPMCQLLFSV